MKDETQIVEREELHPLVRALTQGELDTDNMKRVLEMQERWEDREVVEG